MNRGQNDGARIRMTGAQIVEKFLPEIVGRIDIENEKIRAADSTTSCCASSRLCATSTCACGAASRNAARIALARCSSGARTRTRPVGSDVGDSFTVQSDATNASRLARCPSHLVRNARFSRNEKFFLDGEATRQASRTGMTAARRIERRAPTRPNEYERRSSPHGRYRSGPWSSSC